MQIIIVSILLFSARNEQDISYSVASSLNGGSLKNNTNGYVLATNFVLAEEFVTRYGIVYIKDNIDKVRRYSISQESTTFHNF